MLVLDALLKAGRHAPLPEDERVEGEAFCLTDDEHIPFWDVQRLVAKVACMPVQHQDIRCIPVWLVMALAYFG
jgi:sterol-4alpha-carboxylate 3-dehydrogenase (decarboxylating)